MFAEEERLLRSPERLLTGRVEEEGFGCKDMIPRMVPTAVPMGGVAIEARAGGSKGVSGKDLFEALDPEREWFEAWDPERE
jgi:hypothetical protein